MPFGLYLHFPFCTHKCDYCDYYKEVLDSDMERRFYDALKVETELAEHQAQDTDHQISTLYIGGGTPSLTSLGRFEEWLDHLSRFFVIPNDIEFSFEINPESCGRELLEALLKLGVNRPVFGVQSFNTRLLKMLGRAHNLRQTHEAVYFANALGYDNFGCDLLYALPRQTGKMLSSDLDQLVDLAPPHISFYQLTVEEGTALHRKTESGKLKLPSVDHARALYQAGFEKFTEAGYERYEVCSFAKPGHECRHNLNYWTGGDYIGLGPSAHSFLDSRRLFNKPSLGEYLSELKQGRRPQVEDESGEAERMVEALMVGLRLKTGVNLARFSERFRHDIGDLINPEQYEMLLESGHLIWDEDYLRLSEDSMLLADEITLRLVR